MKQDIHEHKKEFVAAYDNLNVRFNKMEQRVDNQSLFDSGCAATVFVIENQDTPSPDPKAYREQWQRESSNPITALQILDLEDAAAERAFTFNKWLILSFLLRSGQFNRALYKDDNHRLFSRPPPMQQLPMGKEHVHTHYMLDTAHIEEVSLEGNLRCTAEWFRQLGFSDDEIRKLLSYNRLFFFMGDQLTISRLRTLQDLLALSLNCWHRMENLALFFGWLHAQMTQEHSIYEQFLEIGTGGIKHAANLLNRKGLGSTSIQGNFHQRVHDSTLR